MAIYLADLNDPAVEGVCRSEINMDKLEGPITILAAFSLSPPGYEKDTYNCSIVLDSGAGGLILYKDLASSPYEARFLLLTMMITCKFTKIYKR